jgi:hypothetical protein
MHPIMSNTTEGQLVLPAGDDLTDKEGYVVQILNASGTPKVYLPDNATDAALYLLLEGAEADADVTLIPLVAGRNFRAVAKSTTIVAGDKLVAFASGAAGMLTEHAAGDAFIVGIAEETGDTEGQEVLFRPVLSYWKADAA